MHWSYSVFKNTDTWLPLPTPAPPAPRGSDELVWVRAGWANRLFQAPRVMLMCPPLPDTTGPRSCEKSPSSEFLTGGCTGTSRRLVPGDSSVPLAPGEQCHLNVSPHICSQALQVLALQSHLCQCRCCVTWSCWPSPNSFPFWGTVWLS